MIRYDPATQHHSGNVISMRDHGARAEEKPMAPIAHLFAVGLSPRSVHHDFQVEELAAAEAYP